MKRNKNKLSVALCTLTTTIFALSGCSTPFGPKAVSLGNGNSSYQYEMSPGPQNREITLRGKELQEYLRRRARIENAHELRMLQIENMDAERKFIQQKGMTPVIGNQPRPVMLPQTNAPAVLQTNATALYYMGNPWGVGLSSEATPVCYRQEAPPSRPVFTYEGGGGYSSGGFYDRMQNWIGRNSTSFGYYPNAVVERGSGVSVGVFGYGDFQSGGGHRRR